MSVFGAYDIRGLYPTQIDVGFAYKLGVAISHILKPKHVVIGQDARHGSLELANALIDGLLDNGVQVTHIGQASTPHTYFSIQELKAQVGVIVTASHNPKEYVGFKLCDGSLKPISAETGLRILETYVSQLELDYPKAPKAQLYFAQTLDAYISYLLPYSHDETPLSFIIDASGGVGAQECIALFEQTEHLVSFLNTQPDPEFSNHPPNPLLEASIAQARGQVVQTKADFAAVLDGDADRVIFIDEKGQRVPADITLLLLSLQVAKKGQTIVYDDSCSLAVPQELAQKQIIAKPSRSGHTYIKQGMRSHAAIFGGEVSGHYMYKDFFYCESALLTILNMIDLLVESDRPLSALVVEYSKYVQLPQLNVTCTHQEEAFTALRQAFSTCQIQEGDGIRVTSPDFWFKARRSQTEPLVRITLEAKTQQILDDTSKKIIRLLDLFKE